MDQGGESLLVLSSEDRAAGEGGAERWASTADTAQRSVSDRGKTETYYEDLLRPVAIVTGAATGMLRVEVVEVAGGAGELIRRSRWRTTLPFAANVREKFARSRTDVGTGRRLQQNGMAWSESDKRDLCRISSPRLSGLSSIREAGVPMNRSVPARLGNQAFLSIGLDRVRSAAVCGKASGSRDLTPLRSEPENPWEK